MELQPALTLVQLQQIPPDRFEHLIGQLFQKMGYRATVTQHSGDGGIDVIAEQADGIINRRILIQAKRYTGSVGVGVIRDLYGVLSADQEATSAAVITTGTFTAQAREFAQGKRIQLIDGPDLLQLLDQYNVVETSPPPRKQTTSKREDPPTNSLQSLINRVIAWSKASRRRALIILILILFFFCCCCCLPPVAVIDNVLNPPTPTPTLSPTSAPTSIYSNSSITTYSPAILIIQTKGAFNG